MSAYSDLVLADTPYLYWRLGESSGTTAQDATTNNRDGTYNGSPDLAQTGLISGDSDTAVGFNIGETGVGTEYCESASLTLSALTSYALEIWLKPSQATATANIVQGPHNIFSDHQRLAMSSTEFTYRYVDGTGQHVLHSTTAPTTNGVFHILFTGETGGMARLYVNCSLEAEAAVSGTLVMLDGKWTIAPSDDTNSETRYRGIADEFAFYDHAITPTRVATRCHALPIWAWAPGGPAWHLL